MKLWQIGLIVFLLAGALNAIFINLDIGGLPRELARLSVLVGLVIFPIVEIPGTHHLIRLTTHWR